MNTLTKKLNKAENEETKRTVRWDFIIRLAKAGETDMDDGWMDRIRIDIKTER